MRLWVFPMLPTYFMGIGTLEEPIWSKKELLIFRECLLRFVQDFKKFEIFGKNCPWGGHMQKFRSQDGCAWCVHILGMERDCLLGLFKVMKHILNQFWARGYSARPPRPKKWTFLAKNHRFAEILAQKFRPGGRGSGAAQIFFWTTKLHYFCQKNFHGRTKILSSSLKTPRGGKSRPPPPTLFTRI